MFQLKISDQFYTYSVLNPQHRCKVGKVLQLFSKIIPHIKVKKKYKYERYWQEDSIIIPFVSTQSSLASQYILGFYFSLIWLMQRTDTKWLALWTWNEIIPLPQSSKDPWPLCCPGRQRPCTVHGTAALILFPISSLELVMNRKR